VEVTQEGMGTERGIPCGRHDMTRLKDIGKQNHNVAISPYRRHLYWHRNTSGTLRPNVNLEKYGVNLPRQQKLKSML
jgi:hypothetical protein